MDGLLSLSGDLRISANGALTNIAALDNLQNVNGQIFITHNPLLSICNNTFLCNFLSSGYYVEIAENLGACETVDNVLQSCGIILDFRISLK